MCRQWSLRRLGSFAAQSTEQLKLPKETELILESARFDVDDDEIRDEKARGCGEHLAQYAEVTLRFAIVSLILTSVLAFLVGLIARGLLVSSSRHDFAQVTPVRPSTTATSCPRL